MQRRMKSTQRRILNPSKEEFLNSDKGDPKGIKFFVLSLLKVLFQFFKKSLLKIPYIQKKKSVKGQMYGTLNRVYRVLDKTLSIDQAVEFPAPLSWTPQKTTHIWNNCTNPNKFGNPVYNSTLVKKRKHMEKKVTLESGINGPP